ncbi:MAG: hypothetical protein EBV03_03815 [Proteobacteria bacterium]|nr:hypothetical protein [Pseudomonadota bacterium]
MKNNPVYRFLSGVRDCLQWRKRGYASPSPHFIKRGCLLRNGLPSATWVETGTFLGQTTQLLAKHGTRVYSIEPEPGLFARARKLFSSHGNVEILNGTSEDVFPTLLPRLSGDVNFWLDGHYSAGITFKGPQDTPILDELDCISRNIDRFGRICVLVDDIRCFNPRLPEYSTYPSLDALVAWATRHRLDWHIEHDIFIARTA